MQGPYTERMNKQITISTQIAGFPISSVPNPCVILKQPCRCTMIKVIICNVCVALGKLFII